MSHLDRRTLLLGAAGIATTGGLLAACGDDSTSSTATTTTTATDDPPPSIPTGPFLVATFPDGFRGDSPFVHSVEQRVAYVLHDGTDVMRANAPDDVQIEILLDGTRIAGGAVTRRDTGVPTPYYPIRFTPPKAGEYHAVLTNGDETEVHMFLVLEPGETSIPQPGDTLPAIDTATFDDARGVSPVCTRTDPCPFHTVNLADTVRAGGRPTVLSIATPGFCQTAICGPVIDLLIEVVGDRTDIDVVHAEVYVDPNNDDGVQTGSAETTAIVDAFLLPYEPVLFVTDATGTVVRRLDAIYDGSELAEALALI